jgi:hypothetical protein
MVSAPNVYNFQNNMKLAYKNLKNEHNKFRSELVQVKSSYRDLLSKFGGKEIQTRGYRLALSNANELLYEVINQIEGSIATSSIPLKSFINTMNFKIMKLLENSTKELQTLTDVNPQSCLTEMENDNKDPIEDAFNHLRSLLTFQTALKRSAAYWVNTESSDLQSKLPKSMSQEWNTEFSNKGRGKEPGGTMHFSEISGSTVKEHDDTSREPKKKKASASTKIYSQLLTGRQIQQRGKHIFIKVTNGYL